MAISQRKTLIGCLLGCGGMLLVVLILIISFFTWLSRPGVVLNPTRLLGEETMAYVEFTLSAEDPADRDLLYELVDVSQEMNRKNNPLPDSIKTFLSRQNARSQKKDIDKLLPMVAAWTLSPGSRDQPDVHLGTVSVKGFGNQLVLADWILRMTLSRVEDPDVQVVRYEDEAIYRLSPLDPKTGLKRDLVFFVRGADIFVVSDIDAAKTAIDRLIGETNSHPPTEFDRLFASVPARSLRGALVNTNGELRRVWETLDSEADETFLDGLDREVLALTIDGGFVHSGDPELAAMGGEKLKRSFELTANFVCRKAGCEGSGLTERMQQLANALNEQGHAADLHSDATSDGLVVRGAMRDLVGWVESAGQADER